jgi:flagellar hook-associated protein 2
MASTITTSSLTPSSNGTIDVQSLVSQLMAVESQPVNTLNTQVTNDQTQLSTFGNLQSLISSFQTSLQSMTTTSSFSAYSVVSSNSAVAGSVTGSVVTGSYSVNVSSIANAQQLVSVGQASTSTAIGGGTPTTLTFSFGSINGSLNASTGTYGAGTTFTSNGAASQTVTINSSNDTLAGIRDAINNANVGVTATIVNDGSGTPYRLVLTSNNTGANNSMNISVSGDSAISSLISYDPTGTQNLSQAVQATNANLTVNGIPITSSTNSVSDAIQGVTLNLQNTTTSPAVLSIGQDSAAMTNTVQNFVTAYNNLYSFLQTQTAYNTTNSASSGSLMGDNDLTNLMDQMRNLVSTTVGSGSYNSLALIGINTNTANGTISLNTSQFQTALSANSSSVTNLISSSWGIANQFMDWTRNTSNFVVSQRMSDLNTNIADLQTQISDWNTRLADIQSNYTTQFTNLNTLLSSFNTTQTFLTQQMSTFSANSKG